MVYHFADDIPDDYEEFHEFIRLCYQEGWKGRFPSQKAFLKNLQVFINWCNSRKFKCEQAYHLVMAFSHTIGVPIHMFLEHAKLNDWDITCPMDKANSSSRSSVVSVESSASSRVSDTKASPVPEPKPEKKMDSSPCSSYKSSNTVESYPEFPKRTCRRNSTTLTIVTSDLIPSSSFVQVTPPVGDKEKDKCQTEDSEIVCPVNQQKDSPKVHMVKPKPLMVHGISCDALRELASRIDSAGEVEFTVSTAGNYIKVQPESPWDKLKIIEILDKLEIQYYIVPDNVPVLRVVIGRLQADAKEIYEFLKEKGFEVVQVTQLTSKKDDKPLPLFQVQLKKSREAEEIFNLKSIFRIKVKVEKYRFPKKAIQCYRCNGFNHVAANCRIKPRCGICSQEHESRDCSRKILKADERPPPVCCNCSEAHVSSYKGCKAFPDRMSYAQVAKKKEKPQIPTRTARIPDNSVNQLYTPDELLGDASALQKVVKELKDELQVTSLAEVLQIFQQTLENVKKASGLTAKRLAFVECITSAKSSTLDDHV